MCVCVCVCVCVCAYACACVRALWVIARTFVHKHTRTCMFLRRTSCYQPFRYLNICMHKNYPLPQWDSLATSSPLATIALPRTQGNLHDISLLYKCTNASNGCGISFHWDHLPTPYGPTFPPSSSIKTARIPYAQTLQRFDLPNHLGHLLVLPSLPCATRSFLRGSALTLATSGVQVVGG